MPALKTNKVNKVSKHLDLDSIYFITAATGLPYSLPSLSLTTNAHLHKYNNKIMYMCACVSCRVSCNNSNNGFLFNIYTEYIRAVISMRDGGAIDLAGTLRDRGALELSGVLLSGQAAVSALTGCGVSSSVKSPS